MTRKFIEHAIHGNKDKGVRKAFLPRLKDVKSVNTHGKQLSIADNVLKKRKVIAPALYFFDRLLFFVGDGVLKAGEK